MSGVWGNKIKFSIFGESHGVAIGGVLGGIKAGTEIDFDKIDFEMKRRNHRAFYSTARNEKDEYEILSGIKDNTTEGSPIAFIIRNKDQHSGDYVNLNETPRPGHADYPAYVKYGGFNDYRGGGHFSGRITAPLTFAGAVARQILEEKGIKIVSHIYSVGKIKSQSLLDVDLSVNDIEKLHNMPFATLNDEIYAKMEEEIKKCREDLNSVGGIVECAVYGVKPGIGEPFFNSLESEIAQLLFSVPAVKGVEFGKGFGITEMYGYDANDAYRTDGKKVYAKSNNNGGILGGISNGMPIIFKTAVKPTPSIFKTQDTVNLSSNTNDTITLKGRHDVCIVPRAAAVIEAVAALAILDLWED